MGARVRLNKALYFLTTVCLLTACGGNSGEPNPSTPVSQNGDNENPRVSFSPTHIDVASGGSLAVKISAADNVGIASGPDVECTDGGRFENDMFYAPQTSEGVVSICTATIADAAGNKASATLTATVLKDGSSTGGGTTGSTSLFGVTGSAFKGVIRGGTVTIADAMDPQNILAEGLTSDTTGLFEIDVDKDINFTGEYIKVSVTGNDTAKMVCDASTGCGGIVFGDTVELGSDFSMSAIVKAPTSGATKAVNLNMASDLVSAMSENDMSTLDQHNAQVMTVFGLGSQLPTELAFVDIADANAVSGVETVRMNYISGGLMAALYSSNGGFATEYRNFRTEFANNSGEIIVKESIDDMEVISLHDIYLNATDLSLNTSATDTAFGDAITALQTDLQLIDAQVHLDQMTTSGTWPMRDIDAPVVSFNPQQVTVKSGETIAVALQITDADPSVTILSSICTGGTFDSTAQLYTAPADLYQSQSYACTVEVSDSEGNVGSGTFTAEITPLVDDTPPVISFDPANISLTSGTSLPVVLSASDDVELKAVDVSCTDGAAFENDVFTAPVVTETLQATCTATATDLTGNTSSADLVADIIFEPDIEAPVITLRFVDRIELPSGNAIPLDFSVTDNVSVANVAVSIPDRRVTYKDGIVSAEPFKYSFSVEGIITATDSSGNQSEQSFGVDVRKAVDEGPVVTFTPSSLEIASEQSGFTTVTAEDFYGDVVDGPNVTCTDGVIFDAGNVIVPAVTEDKTATCTATATDDAGLEGSTTLAVKIIANAPNPNVFGKVTYKVYGTDPVTFALDRDVEIEKPARFVTVELVGSDETVLATGKTDNEGNYDLSLLSYEDVQVRVKLELTQDGAPDQSIFVGTTAAGVIPGTVLPLNGIETPRDVKIGLSARLEALDVVHEAMSTFNAADPSMVFPPLRIRFSSAVRFEEPENISRYYKEDIDGETFGVIEIGQHGLENDTFDRHVIAHQWVHYLEDSYAREDTLKGKTNLDNAYNASDAFSDGLANAFAAIILKDPVYKDTTYKLEGSRKVQIANSFDVETGEAQNPGWYNVGSVQRVIYDLFDETNEVYASSQTDNVTLGLGPLLEALQHPIHADTPYFTSIFSFREALSEVSGGDSFSSVFGRERIFGRTADANKETNDGGDTENLPLYNEWLGEKLTLCSTVSEANNGHNSLGIVRNIAFTVLRPESFSFRVQSSRPIGQLDPDLVIFKKGEVVAIGEERNLYLEAMTKTLEPGEYILSVFDAFNFYNNDRTRRSCMDITGTYQE